MSDERALDPADPSSKYVVPTGSGYLGTYTVDTNHKITISTAALANLDWTIASRISAVDHPDGVALRPAADPPAQIAEYTLCSRPTHTILGRAVADAPELEPGDDVRVYDLQAVDERDGMLLVDAADDPRVVTDGGRDAPGYRDFELTLEYTTMDGRRQRVTYVPKTAPDDDARRTTSERRDGKWRETGSCPISDLLVHLQNHAGRSGDYYAGP